MTYEVLPPMQDEQEEVILVASFTANNGIRIALQEIYGDRVEFDFDKEQARIVGEALIRWSECVS